MKENQGKKQNWIDGRCSRRRNEINYKQTKQKGNNNGIKMRYDKSYNKGIKGKRVKQMSRMCL